MVDISARERIWIEALWESLPELASQILGAPIELGKLKISVGVEETAKKNYYSVLADGSPDGVNLFFGIDECSAIAFAGLLVMMQEKVIKEKISRREMDEDDLDAMSECVNQLTSVFNEVTKSKLDSDAHLVFQNAGLNVPAELDRFREKRIIVARSKLVVGELHTGELRVIVPEMLFTGRAPEQADEDIGLSAEEAAALREVAGEGQEIDGKVAVYLPTRRDEDTWQQLLHDGAMESFFASNLHNIRRRCLLGELACVLIDADACDQGGLPALAYMVACEDVNIPVTVVASSPTKTHLVACLSSGSFTYLVKPLNPDELRGSIEQIVEAWHQRQAA